jgi:hypothetical protein
MNVDTLVRDPQAADEPRFARAPEAPVRACANCGAGLAAGQDWCLECGTAAPAHPTPAPAAPTHTAPTTSTPAHTPPPVTGPQPIDLGADAAQLYDPYKRAASSSDPADSYDDDPTTAWKVSTPADGKEMQLGLIVDLGKKRSIKQLDLQTSTPGFDVELYAADTAQAPPDILDTRWAHLHNGDGVAKKDSVRLASDSHKYRWVLMWFTAPPQKAPTVKISEFKILG